MKIVAPAGSLERFYAAISAGAQEIYMGLKGFGARRNAVNLTLQEYKEAIDYAHERGVQVFLTLNTIMTDNEIEAISVNLKELYKQGLDAVIVQDLGLARYIKENFPNLALHGSTQMTVANHIEANYLKKIGFERVVLPRELSFEEIKRIREHTDIELEIFVSGALCISYSGNCYMSSFIGGRSGNRGMCAQPCRKKYKSSGCSGYLLSPKDQMYGYEEIKKLKEIGIDSIKLEGRMKEPNYVFQMVSYYKELIEGKKAQEKVTDIFNRGYSLGYFYKKKDNILNKDYASHIGKKIGRKKGKNIVLDENIILGDGLIYLDKNYETIGGAYINKIEIKGENRKKALKGEEVYIGQIPEKTTYIYRNFAKEIKDETENLLKKQDKKQKISIEFIAKIGERAKIIGKVKNIYSKEIKEEYLSEKIVEKAQNKGVSKEVIKEKLSELGDTTFELEVVEIEKDKDIFLPISVIKEMRRDLTSILNKKLIDSYRRENISVERRLRKRSEEKKSILAAVVRDETQKRVAEKFGLKIYKYGYDVAKEGNLEKIDLSSTLATNLYQILENKNEKITVNWNLNISNGYALEQISELKKVDTVILSPELSYKRIEEIGDSKIRKALLVYGKPKGMYLEIQLDEKELVNEQGDKFTVINNDLGNSEIYLEKPLNILSKRKELEKLGIEELILEFTDETESEIEEILRGKGRYTPYNYEKGVY